MENFFHQSRHRLNTPSRVLQVSFSFYSPQLQHLQAIHKAVSPNPLDTLPTIDELTDGTFLAAMFLPHYLYA
jgi:hypothetical protein